MELQGRSALVTGGAASFVGDAMIRPMGEGGGRL
jgi:hypothetical protein